jgi:hypothetical protein
MLPDVIATETIVRVRATTTTNTHGNATSSWDSPGVLTITGCSVQPVTGDEVILNRDAVTSRWQLFAPLDADLLSSDRVRHRGVDYEIDGSVQRWPDFGGLGHTACYLTLVEG